MFSVDHTILSIQNILYFLVYFLTQKLSSNKEHFLTKTFEICSFVSEELMEDETSFFMQFSLLAINNLIQLHLYSFKKV